MVDIAKEMGKERKKFRRQDSKILRKPKARLRKISSSQLLKSFAQGHRKLVRDEIDANEEIKMEKARWI